MSRLVTSIDQSGLVPRRWHDDWQYVNEPEKTVPNQAHVTERDPGPVIYGPRGEVLRTVHTRPSFGFNRRPEQ